MPRFRLRNWEARERRKAKDYEKERERERCREEEREKEAKRLKEFLEDYDDERDDHKYYKVTMERIMFFIYLIISVKKTRSSTDDRSVR